MWRRRTEIPWQIIGMFLQPTRSECSSTFTQTVPSSQHLCQLSVFIVDQPYGIGGGGPAILQHLGGDLKHTNETIKWQRHILKEKETNALATPTTTLPTSCSSVPDGGDRAGIYLICPVTRGSTLPQLSVSEYSTIALYLSLSLSLERERARERIT